MKLNLKIRLGRGRRKRSDKGGGKERKMVEGLEGRGWRVGEVEGREGREGLGPFCFIKIFVSIIWKSEKLDFNLSVH